MNLTISNIAWQVENDFEMYDFLKNHDLKGLEVAPTRIFGNDPYSNLDEVKVFKNKFKKDFGLKIVSLQSICFGKNEAIFSSVEERNILLNYIKEAIDFASVLECENLVFGCPKNRNISEGQENIAIDFFTEIGNYANDKNTIFALEPNPVIYGTNFLNTTQQALDFVKKCNVDGLKVNFDLGTVIYNDENLSVLNDNLQWINHVHISEPYLNEIQNRELHKELAAILKNQNYQNFISLEMKSGSELEKIKDIIIYAKDVFGN